MKQVIKHRDGGLLGRSGDSNNVMESGKEMASKSIENTTNKLVKEWLEKEK